MAENRINVGDTVWMRCGTVESIDGEIVKVRKKVDGKESTVGIMDLFLLDKRRYLLTNG